MRAFLVLLLVAAAHYVALAAFAWWKSRARVSRLFSLVMLCAALWAIAYYGELHAGSLADKLFWLHFRTPFMLAVPLIWLAMVLEIVEGGRWLRGWRWWPLLALQGLTIVADWWPGAGWYRHDFRVEQHQGLGVLFFARGPWNHFQAAVVYLLSFYTLWLLAREWRLASAIRRRQVAAIFVAYALPLLLNTAWQAGVSPIPGLNLAMFSLLFTAWVWVWGLFGYSALDLVPLARATLLDHMRSLMLVVDATGRLADFNQAAARRLGLPARGALGHPAALVVPAPWRDFLVRPTELEGQSQRIRLGEGDGAAWYEHVVVPIRGGSETLGTTYFFHDISERVRREDAEREQARLAEERRLVHHQAMLLRDLHDGLGGVTANIGMMAALGRKADTLDGKDRALAGIAQLAAEGNAEVRSLMSSLESRDLAWPDLMVEMRRFGAALLEEQGLAFSLEVTGGPPASGPGLYAGMSCFRIYKEALTNVTKHAHATSVDCRLQFAQDGIELRVRDNGRGLGAAPGKGRGLNNMRQRAEDLGGRLDIEDGNGLTLSLRLPAALPPPKDDERR